jgi:pyruvate/2-oxoacid:ferredoxin oxidoreductase alpha subunit/Pyruvate/2-oxoacid:ferredoxin oxidoreductase delta subunit
MSEIIEKLSCKIGEGYQSVALGITDSQVNVFHRTVTTHESSDIAFINGLVSTGLRGSAFIDGEKLINNYNQFLTASRQHLPIVVNTNARLVNSNSYSTINNYTHINGIQQTGCFQLIANSKQEEVYLTLIAHRISELSLIPGIVISDYALNSEKVDLPEDELIINYLGNPDDQIDCPTPAQEIIFGKKRRRVPNWYNLDVPVMLGIRKEDKALSFEDAASQKYFYDHLPQLIKQAYQEFNAVFGINIKPITTKGGTNEYAVISIGGQVGEYFDQISDENKKPGWITINQLHPFPFNELTEITKNKKAITILENSSSSGIEKSAFYYNVSSASNTKVYSGKYSSELDAAILEKAVQHMLSNQPQNDYYLGLDFTNDSSQYPKHEILLQEISKQYPEIAKETINTKKESVSIDLTNEMPLAVRMYQDKGPTYSRLSRFYSDTAFFHEHNEPNELVADPFAAVPLAPSASASFFNQTTKRESLPIFDAKKCTGCGDCFVQCPHSALPPIAVGVEQLVKTGVEMAVANGTTVNKLTPMVKNLAKVAGTVINDTDVVYAKDFLPAAFESLANQMNLTGGKLDEAEQEFSSVVSQIGNLKVAITDQFYTTPNAMEPGSGDLFSLAVNPTACTGCSVCVQVCSEDALTMETQGIENLTTINEQFKLWEQLPDTSGDTINRLYNDEKYSSLSAMLLSRSYYMSMFGASPSENDNPYKTLLHIITATTESVVQPKIVSQLKNIDDLIDDLSENIHNKLSQALPKDNLENLSKSLKKAQGRKLTIKDVVNQVSEHESGKMIDTALLERKTDLVEELKDLKWILSEGPTGVGRSRYGMLLAGSNSMGWAKQYPANNFTSPSVIHWNGSAPDQTLGMFYGQLRYLLDNIKLMRRATLESNDKYDTAIHDLEIANLNWEDLTADEKKLIPPILLVAERDDLNDAGWSSLNKLMAGKYPVKVFLFDHISSPNNSPMAALAQTNSGMFSTIGLKNAYVFQGGIGNIDHLFNGLLDGLDRAYPALFNLYATKYEKHGVTNIDWSPYASLAINSRAFPAFRFDPGEKSDFLSGAISLEGNKENQKDWIQEEVTVSEEENLTYQITWADWAYTQKDWENHFTSVEEDITNVLIPEYIKLEGKAREGQIPVIMRAGKEGLKYYSISDKVVGMTEAVLAHWNTLQEVAGLLTEFPMKLREEVAKELSVKYEKEMAELKKDYEQQLSDQKASQTEVLRQQLKEKLVALSKMAKS